MSNSDWYPASLALRVAFHANLAVQATATGTSHGLTAGQVTQIVKDASDVAVIVNYLLAVDDYAQSVTAFKDAIWDMPIGTILPALPAGLAALSLSGGVQGIMARTRQYVALIKASVGYTDSIGELYGIVAPAPAPPGTPSIEAIALPSYQIQLNVTKAGYTLVAIESRRAGGAWELIGVAQTATFIDNRPPLISGQPELREYRCQGMENNVRVGAISAVVSAVTIP